MGFKRIDIADIKGFKLGNAEDAEAATGCTVIICEEGATAGVDVRGGGPATRETDLLKSEKTVEQINAVVISGGSAFGLEAGSGVMRYLEKKGVGFKMGDIVVPIVSQASLYDLEIGRSDVRPDVAMGTEACENAEKGIFSNGNHGAGTGATVGKYYGMNRAMKTGLGTYACSDGELELGAVTAVNAFADVLDAGNHIIAGLVSADGRRIDGTIKCLKNAVRKEKSSYSSLGSEVLSAINKIKAEFEAHRSVIEVPPTPLIEGELDRLEKTINDVRDEIAVAVEAGEAKADYVEFSPAKTEDATVEMVATGTAKEPVIEAVASKSVEEPDEVSVTELTETLIEEPSEKIAEELAVETVTASGSIAAEIIAESDAAKVENVLLGIEPTATKLESEVGNTVVAEKNETNIEIADDIIESVGEDAIYKEEVTDISSAVDAIVSEVEAQEQADELVEKLEGNELIGGESVSKPEEVLGNDSEVVEADKIAIEKPLETPATEKFETSVKEELFANKIGEPVEISADKDKELPVLEVIDEKTVDIKAEPPGELAQMLLEQLATKVTEKIFEKNTSSDGYLEIKEEDLNSIFEEELPSVRDIVSEILKDNFVSDSEIDVEDNVDDASDSEYDHVFNTTISCLITNAKLTKTECNKLASILHDGYARAIKPVHSSLDGDTIFVMTTGEVEVNFDAFAALATDIVQYSIIDSALSAVPAYGLKAASSFKK